MDGHGDASLLVVGRSGSTPFDVPSAMSVRELGPFVRRTVVAFSGSEVLPPRSAHQRRDKSVRVGVAFQYADEGAANGQGTRRDGEVALLNADHAEDPAKGPCGEGVGDAGQAGRVEAVAHSRRRDGADL